MKSFSVRAMIVAAAVAAMTACGSSIVANSPSHSASPSATPSPAKVATLDPCTLVTAAEASSAAGRTLADSTTFAGGFRSPGACLYRNSNNSANVLVYAQVFAKPAIAAAVTVEQVQAAARSALGQSSTQTTEISGIGDRAYEFTTKAGPGAGVAIVVFKSNVVFLIAIAPSNKAGTVEDLAKTAAGQVH